jgi:hypothetical protein
MIPALVYTLCSLTSLACAVVLLKSYFKTRVRLLLWSGLGFVAITVNNVLLFIDLVVVPTIDISQPRIATGLLGVAIIVYGLIRESS